MTTEEINQLTEKLYSRFKHIPSIDRSFIYKCVYAISSLGDPDVDAKIRRLGNFL